MTEGHPAPGLLEAFMRSEASAPDRLRIVRHLLRGCPRCVAVTRRVWSLGEPRAQEARESLGAGADRCPTPR
ncbi:MAG TPA: hypothetical protein VF789_03785 [Thermoanaerobaculia bacterium]